MIFSLPEDCASDIICVLPTYCKTIPKPSSYVSSIVSENYYPALRPSLQQHSFKVFPVSTTSCTGPTEFSHASYLTSLNIMARIDCLRKNGGNHLSVFHPKFCHHNNISKSYANAERSASVVIINRSQDRHKVPNKNTSLFKGEKSVDFFQHIILTLCSQTGLIFHSNAGTLTAGMASPLTGRGAVLIERTSRLYSYGIGKLRIHCTRDTSMTYLTEYADPIDVDGVVTLTLPGVQPNADSSDFALSIIVDGEMKKEQKESFLHSSKRGKVFKNHTYLTGPSDILNDDVHTSNGTEPHMIMGPG